MTPFKLLGSIDPGLAGSKNLTLGRGIEPKLRTMQKTQARMGTWIARPYVLNQEWSRPFALVIRVKLRRVSSHPLFLLLPRKKQRYLPPTHSPENLKRAAYLVMLVGQQSHAIKAVGKVHRRVLLQLPLLQHALCQRRQQVVLVVA